MTRSRAGYVSMIEERLAEGGEASLIGAYELGREALDGGLGILDVLAIQDEVLRRMDGQAMPASAVTDFFREMISPFEMTYRGYREANAELSRLNQQLKEAYAELQSNQLQLIQAVKMASLGQLVAGIAHEINNPLSFVISHVETVRRNLQRLDSGSGEARATWNTIQARLEHSKLGLERIRDLVLKLRTFSRLDEGEQKVISMRESIDSLLTIMQHRLEGRIDIHTNYSAHDLVECMPALLNQAVANLVSNAIDAIEHTGAIWIETGFEGDDYFISVSDTGSGIPSDILDRVVEPFYTTKPAGSGTGLGLSIAHSVVQRHGGSLSLSERSGGGTSAIIRLPGRATPVRRSKKQ